MVQRSTLSPERQDALAQDLKHIIEVDGGFLPDAAYELIQKLVCWAVPELAIYNFKNEVLLKYRDDQHFKGWHLIGGNLLPGETLAQACTRHAREDGLEGVHNVKQIGIHPWLKGQHPFGHPCSIICACEPSGLVTEREDLRWFDHVPPNMIPQQHPEFLKFIFNWLKTESKDEPKTAARIL